MYHQTIRRRILRMRVGNLQSGPIGVAADRSAAGYRGAAAFQLQQQLRTIASAAHASRSYIGREGICFPWLDRTYCIVCRSNAIWCSSCCALDLQSLPLQIGGFFRVFPLTGAGVPTVASPVSLPLKAAVACQIDHRILQLRR